MKKLFIPLTLILAALVLWAISGSDYVKNKVEAHAIMEYGASADLSAIFTPAPANPYLECLPEMPDPGAVKMRVKPVLPSIGKAFNDLNATHLEAACSLGISPIQTDGDAWRLRRPLVELQSCREYYLDDLTHSYPYLVPEAADLLTEIGSRFNEELQKRGGGNYRIKVTSALRTPATVSKLRRVNRNATGESAHAYGTTFDISHAKFICDSVGVVRTQEDLKNLLAEIIDSLHRAGRLYVKHEYKQACFHITAK